MLDCAGYEQREDNVSITKIVIATALLMLLLGASKVRYPKVAHCVGLDGGKFTLPKLVKRIISSDYTVQYYPKTGHVEYCNTFDCFQVPLGTEVSLKGGMTGAELKTRCE